MKKKNIFVLVFCLVFIQFSLFASKELKQNSFSVFYGNSNPNLAKEVAYILGVNLSRANVGRFRDGEVRIKIEENIRGKEIYILQSICATKEASVNDNLMELFLLIRACKRASAKKITAVIPYFGYARQDRKTEERGPISAADIAMLLENAGADQIITLDLHCGQIQGFFQNISVDNLMTNIVFVPYIERKNLENLVVIAPDAGALARAKNFIEGLSQYNIKAQLSMIVKQPSSREVLEKLYLIGDVKNCDVVIIDDMCDTGVTLIQTAKELKKKGANKVFACITHPVFSKNFIEEIQGSGIDEMIVTDTIPMKYEISSKITQISIAPLIAEAIKRCQNKDTLTFEN